MTGTLFQNGAQSDFFATPVVSFEDIRGWIKTGGGEDGIGLGAVVEVDENDKVTRIAGELVMPGGAEAYLVGKDGVAHLITPDDEKKYKVTFAQVGCMPDTPPVHLELDIKGTDDLKRQLQKELGKRFKRGENESFMVRVDGEFSHMNLRGIDTENRDVGALNEIKQLVEGENAKQNFNIYNKPYRLIGVYSKKGAVQSGVTFDDTLHMHAVETSPAGEGAQHGGHVMSFGVAHVKVDVLPIGHWLQATREQAHAAGPATVGWVDKIRNPAGPAAGRQ